MQVKVAEKEVNGHRVRLLSIPGYNYMMDYTTGQFLRWGKTFKDDPEYSPIGPEIMDIELSTICSRACPWCYKSNTSLGSYMTFETFKSMFEKFPKCLTQIAFGIGDIPGCPDLFKIMTYVREQGVVPNITINGDFLDDESAEKLSKLCGSLAVSLYDKDLCYNAVKKLTDLGMTQINIHSLLCEETFDKCMNLIQDSKTDPRLAKLNAIVFLWLKPKGKRNKFTRLTSLDKYKTLVEKSFEIGARIGFDSCSAPAFLEVVKDRPEYKSLEMLSEGCESTLFSYYINADGIGFPCSFAEDQPEFKGIDILKAKSFIKDVWYNPETVAFRNKVIQNKDCRNCRKCQVFDLSIK
jgi:radical SAM protein with 4Fe4S-binding SPASM domain